MERNHYKLLGKENSSENYCVKFQDPGFFLKINKAQDLLRLSRTIFKFQDFPGICWTCGNPGYSLLKHAFKTKTFCLLFEKKKTFNFTAHRKEAAIPKCSTVWSAVLLRKYSITIDFRMIWWNSPHWLHRSFTTTKKIIIFVNPKHDILYWIQLMAQHH